MIQDCKNQELGRYAVWLLQLKIHQASLRSVLALGSCNPESFFKKEFAESKNMFTFAARFFSRY
jgi:hypothetical protein